MEIRIGHGSKTYSTRYPIFTAIHRELEPSAITEVAIGTVHCHCLLNKQTAAQKVLRWRLPRMLSSRAEFGWLSATRVLDDVLVSTCEG
jgi:hypothetical protein